jgi:hypothetical protein
MERIDLKAHVGEDGILRLEIPIGQANVDVLVRVYYHIQRTMTPEEWQAFIDSTYGSLADDPIERGDQGEIRVRDELT